MGLSSKPVLLLFGIAAVMIGTVCVCGLLHLHSKVIHVNEQNDAVEQIGSLVQVRLQEFMNQMELHAHELVDIAASENDLSNLKAILSQIPLDEFDLAVWERGNHTVVVEKGMGSNASTSSIVAYEYDARNNSVVQIFKSMIDVETNTVSQKISILNHSQHPYCTLGWRRSGWYTLESFSTLQCGIDYSMFADLLYIEHEYGTSVMYGKRIPQSLTEIKSLILDISICIVEENAARSAIVCNNQDAVITKSNYSLDVACSRVINNTMTSLFLTNPFVLSYECVRRLEAIGMFQRALDDPSIVTTILPVAATHNAPIHSVAIAWDAQQYQLADSIPRFGEMILLCILCVFILAMAVLALHFFIVRPVVDIGEKSGNAETRGEIEVYKSHFWEVHHAEKSIIRALRELAVVTKLVPPNAAKLLNTTVTATKSTVTFVRVVFECHTPDPLLRGCRQVLPQIIEMTAKCDGLVESVEESAAVLSFASEDQCRVACQFALDIILNISEDLGSSHNIFGIIDTQECVRCGIASKNSDLYNKTTPPAAVTNATRFLSSVEKLLKKFVSEEICVSHRTVQNLGSDDMFYFAPIDKVRNLFLFGTSDEPTTLYSLTENKPHPKQAEVFNYISQGNYPRAIGVMRRSNENISQHFSRWRRLCERKIGEREAVDKYCRDEVNGWI